MKTNAYIFIGQSGSGKGTQASLLAQSIQGMHPSASILHFETGALFRSFTQTDSYTAKKTKEAMDQGILPASFIGVHVWSHELINAYTGQEYVIIDGTPRVREEVPILLSAAKFYGWELHVVYLEVGDAWADARLRARARADDIDEHERASRLAWFHDNVAPAIELLKTSPEVSYSSINGERSIEEIHHDICTNLSIQ